MVAASARPRYFSPSPSLLDGEDGILIAMLLPDIQQMRTVARTLPLRAMWHLGEGRTVEAWQDLLACHRLARLTAQNNTLVGQLVAIAIDGVATEATRKLLHHGNLDLKTAKQIQADINQLGEASSCKRVIDVGERACFLDLTLILATGEEASLSSLTGGPTALDAISLARIDWNGVLREGNHWYDQLFAAAKLPTRDERLAEFGRIDDQLSQVSMRVNSPSAWIGGALNGKRRSELVGDILVSLMLPATSAAFNAEDRSNTQLELTRLAAALAVYRAEQGEYPKQLAHLVPDVILKLPLDMYSGKPFIYQRKEDGGYLLYSVFENEIDDRGTGMGGEVIEGEWVEEGSDEYDYEESDLVIRVPVPDFKFPKPPTAEEVDRGYYDNEYGE